MRSYQISIPHPCTEDWDTMAPAEQGKHCAACNKVAIDFSKMNDREILTILLQYKGKKVCGNFYHTQIEKPLHYPELKKYTKWPAIAAMLIAGMFQLMPATGTAQKENPAILHPTSLSIQRNPGVKVEPAKDSVVTYSVKILSKQSRVVIMGAMVTIENIGTYTSDPEGMIYFNVSPDKIPDLVNIEVSAYGYQDEKIMVGKNQVTKNRGVELWLTKREELMLRGDVSIDPSN